ncbi:MAG: hypothetical protein NVS2B8_02830 [Vulcanimicrobiaceae bacterium]
MMCSIALAQAMPTSVDARQTQRLHGDVFVVDPGHGTRYPGGAPNNVGAVGPSGVAENAVTLAVGEKLAALLRAQGARVELTRSFAHPYRTSSDKRRDNRDRAALANRLHATAFLAIHADASLDRSVRGTSIFWLRPNSEPLARAVRAHLRPLALGESAYRVRDLAVTNEARVPAVLVELGYISNPDQERELATSGFQDREARALFDAVTETFAK